ncbi:MAG: RHS repeat-associated core domain-containing protein, partial [Anaerostipes sp.]|nr:RHS repeat-associated core domain-containing protein [Anaerostipes sp.]
SLIKEDGTADATYTYTDFGETRIQGDNTAGNEVCYTGGVYDSSTGLYYLNARYYNPEDGRFLTEDTYRGESTEPDTQNLYAYCVGNPVNYVDPSGHKKQRNWTPLPTWRYGVSQKAKKFTRKMVQTFLVTAIGGVATTYVGIARAVVAAGVAGYLDVRGKQYAYYRVTYKYKYTGSTRDKNGNRIDHYLFKKTVVAYRKKKRKYIKLKTTTITYKSTDMDRR